MDTSDGRVQWRHRARRGDAVTLAGDRVLVHDDDATTPDAAHDPDSGDLVDEGPVVLPSPAPTSAPSVAPGGGVIEVVEDAVERRDVDGRIVWRLPLAAPSVVSVDPLVVFGDGVLLRVDDPAV